KIVLRNVLDNAIKFCGNGDQISIYTRDHSNSEVALIVEDTGAGISQSSLNELLKKTRSMSNSINQERTGLGLHLCHAMLLKNGGKLDIESKEGVGTKLIITLPLSQDYE
ncbi:MAG: sensor histidine kinase, partial [Crocinitomicaceae bacterium]